jgi:hypothetical protein
VNAAIDDIALFDSMPDDPDAAMRASRSKLLDCTLEAVERVGFLAQAQLESLVIIIAALVTFGHGRFLLLNSDPPPEPRQAPPKAPAQASCSIIRTTSSMPRGSMPGSFDCRTRFQPFYLEVRSADRKATCLHRLTAWIFASGGERHVVQRIAFISARQFGQD